jgi:hypothetical protein
MHAARNKQTLETSVFGIDATDKFGIRCVYAELTFAFRVKKIIDPDKIISLLIQRHSILKESKLIMN